MRKYKYFCSGKDDNHSCFDADFDGVCQAYFGSRLSYESREKAKKAGLKHEDKCRFDGTTHVQILKRDSKEK